MLTIRERGEAFRGWRRGVVEAARVDDGSGCKRDAQDGVYGKLSVRHENGSLLQERLELARAAVELGDSAEDADDASCLRDTEIVIPFDGDFMSMSTGTSFSVIAVLLESSTSTMMTFDDGGGAVERA